MEEICCQHVLDEDMMPGMLGTNLERLEAIARQDSEHIFLNSMAGLLLQMQSNALASISVESLRTRYYHMKTVPFIRRGCRSVLEMSNAIAMIPKNELNERQRKVCSTNLVELQMERYEEAKRYLIEHDDFCKDFWISERIIDNLIRYEQSVHFSAEWNTFTIEWQKILDEVSDGCNPKTILDRNLRFKNDYCHLLSLVSLDENDGAIDLLLCTEPQWNVFERNEVELIGEYHRLMAEGFGNCKKRRQLQTIEQG